MIGQTMRRAGIALGALLCMTAAHADPQFTGKFGLATLNDAQHIYVKNYAAALEKDSGGRIHADVFPASQLGSIPRMIEQTQFGSIQLWVGPPEFLTGVDARFELLGAPGIFHGMEHTNKVLQDPKFGPEFLKIGEKKGLVGVGLFISGSNAFVMRTPVNNIEGFAGMKVRVFASPMQTEQMRVLKATAVPMSLGEVLPALQQGALDGALGSPPVFTPLKYMSAAKYLVYTQQSVTTSIAVVSRKWLQSMPADLQKIVVEDGMREAATLFPTSNKLLDESFDGWKAGGGEVITWPKAELDRLDALMAPIPAAVVAARPEEKPMFDLLMASVNRNK